MRPWRWRLSSFSSTDPSGEEVPVDVDERLFSQVGGDIDEFSVLVENLAHRLLLRLATPPPGQTTRKSLVEVELD